MALCSSRLTLMALAVLVVMMGPVAYAQQAQPVLSREPASPVGAVPLDDEAVQGQAVARKASVGQHAMLAAYEQCGGERGLCNTTTIGVPCGDHPWGLECPGGFECQRKTAAIWQCNPLPGVRDPSAAASNGTGVVSVQVNNGTTPLSGFGPASSSNSTQPTPEVCSSCPPGAIAVGSRCVKNAGSSRRAVAGTLASSVALLAVWQVAVVLVTALLAC